MSKVPGVRELAKRLRRSEQAVRKGIKAGRLSTSIRRGEGGQIEIPDLAAAAEEWRASARRIRVDDGDADSIAAWRAARTRRETALATLAEDQLRKSRGELVPVADVVTKLAAEYTSARTKLLGIPSRLRQRDPGMTQGQLALVESLIREALEDLAEGRA